MQGDAPFSVVLKFLEKHGYRLLRRRKFPDEENAGFVVFGRDGSPNIGFPVRNRKVAHEYFKSLVEAFEGGTEESASDQP
jgi:hypothetical protein